MRPARSEPTTSIPLRSRCREQFGAEMAMQMGIAYSSRIMGVGIFAPAWAYDCRRKGHNLWSSECNLRFSESVAQLEATIRGWSGREIDQVEYLKGAADLLFRGCVRQFEDFVCSQSREALRAVRCGRQRARRGDVRRQGLASH